MDVVRTSVIMLRDRITARRGERKFTLALLIITLASVLVVLEQLTGRQWVEICGATMLFFGTANAAEHFSKGRGEPK